MKRNPTKYPGVTFIENKDGEKVFYIRYRKNGKMIEEKVGGQFSRDMSPARASNIRNDRRAGKEKSNAEQEQDKLKAKLSTIDNLWKRYVDEHPKAAEPGSDKSRYQRHISPVVGGKTPNELVALDIQRIKKSLEKNKPQTVAHVLNLLKRIINYGAALGVCGQVQFKIVLPRKIDNIRTECLTDAQLQSLFQVLDTTEEKTAAAMMKMALFTGMRRGELLKLTWKDVDFERSLLHIMEPKGGKSQSIPMNKSARAVLEAVPKTEDRVFHISPWSLRDISKALIKQAGIPDDFRPMHGLRHTFASLLASSGQVDLYTLQKLMTHKDFKMTQRYAHLRDETLRNGAAVADSFIDLGKRGKVIKMK
jgi:integrase